MPDKNVTERNTQQNTRQAAPEETLLAFDYGLRKIGVAVGNTVTRQAQPLAILRLPAQSSRQARFDAIAKLLQQWQPARLIVGLPLTLDGQEQPASRHSRRFANQLNGRFNIAVELVDERGSSMQAQNMMDAKLKHEYQGDDDALAAAVILERWLAALP